MALGRLRRWGRPASLPGVGLLLFLGVGLPAACGGPPADRPDPEVEAARSLGLGEGARLHRVTLGGRGSEEHAVPRLVDALPGDAVEFVTVDHRVHTITFPSDSLTPEARVFLETTGQGGSAPLAIRGSRFLLRLEDAPPGRYPFLSEGHGGIAGGAVRVGLPGDTLSPRSP